MKVLHVIPSISLRRGGPSSAILNLCRGLARAGVDVTLATTDDDGKGHLDVALSVPVERDGYTTWYFKRQTRPYCFSWPLTRWLAQHVRDYDCVHIHAVFSYPTIPASIAASLSGVPYIVTPHGILMAWGRKQRRPIAKRVSIELVEKQVIRGAALLHLTSEQEHNEMPDMLKSLPSVVLPFGIDLEPFRKLPPTGWLTSQFEALRNRRIILFLGRLDPTKGLGLLLDAFQQVVKQDASVALVIAGTGDPAIVSSLQAQVAHLGIRGDVFFTGFLEEEKKVAAMADADIFVLSSRSESFGISAIEAMACGLPVIVSNRVGIHRLISEAGAGIVVPCETEALAEALEELLVDENLRRNKGDAASALARGRFSLETVSPAMIDIYARAMAAS